MGNLFVYGSLLNEEVWLRFFKTTFLKCDAKLNGYERKLLNGYSFPAIRKKQGCFVEGAVVKGLNGRDFRLLDQFEGGFYKRVSVNARTKANQSIQCEVYVLKARYRHLMSDKDWNNREFRKNDMDKFLSRYRGQ